LVTGLLASAYETFLVHRLVRPKYSWGFIGKVLIASMAMGGVVWGGWSLEISRSNPSFAAGFLIVIGGLVFAVMVIILKPISPENIDVLRKSNLPKKDLIFRLATVQKKS